MSFSFSIQLLKFIVFLLYEKLEGKLWILIYTMENGLEVSKVSKRKAHRERERKIYKK